MSTKKYVSISKLSLFLNNLRNTFAALSHSHTISDISDFAVDDTLSSTSTNPVQNKILNAEFDAIAESFTVLEASIDDIAKNVDNSNLPEISDNDNGKVLRVVDGEWKADDLPIYDGAYEITPSASTEQTLMTSGKMMDADVKVNKIPYAEVTNSSNGTTVTIGSEA